MTSYVALLHREADSDYGVEFPDFPGCVTAGKTLEDARRMAAEALAFHVDGLREDGAPIPRPAPLDAIMADPDSRTAVAFLVDVADRPAKPMRINVVLPDDLVRAIDTRTNNRSRFLEQAARARLAAEA